MYLIIATYLVIAAASFCVYWRWIASDENDPNKMSQYLQSFLFAILWLIGLYIFVIYLFIELIWYIGKSLRKFAKTAWSLDREEEQKESDATNNAT